LSNYLCHGFALLSFTLGGCGYARTPYLLKTMNSGVGGTVQPRPAANERIARVAQQHIQDSYFGPKLVATWMAAVGKDSTPISTQLACMRSKRPTFGVCYNQIDLDAATTWGLPPVPLATVAQSGLLDPVALTEIDAQRFMSNARWIASSLQVLEDSLGRPLTDNELQSGIQLGMQRASAYLEARSWHRQTSRPTTALVMSGGAATGAFIAGFVSRIMDVFQTCHHSRAGDACPNATIDLVVGTSTGTLIGVMVDLFQVPGQETNAKRLLVDNYTCSTEKDLYCKHDEWDWHLAENMRGLMRFNGIEKKIKAALISAMRTNASELVTLAVDYDSGDLFAQSDQDPRDRASDEARVQTLLSSIVEPIMADPVDNLTSGGKPLKGTFIDAGVRSGLPLREAVWRGAERTLIISTANVDIGPAPHAPAALQILFRTVDIATSQNFIGELQQAEFEAAARRTAEYNLCDFRLRGAGVDLITRKSFCRRDNLWKPAAKEIATSFAVGPGLFPDVANAWQSTWINRPETSGPGATGFSFDPAFMRNLFKWGVRTFQTRCRESLALLNVPTQLQSAEYACGNGDQKFVEAKVAEAEKNFKPLASCHPSDHDIPDCE
jgi:predicted acylesterase/phospholipase RssA